MVKAHRIALVTPVGGALGHGILGTDNTEKGEGGALTSRGLQLHGPMWVFTTERAVSVSGGYYTTER